MSDDIRARALALYKAPFRFERGYIYDAEKNIVADDPGGQPTDPALRLRGWGRISYLPEPEKLQDAVGELIADAMTAFWQARAQRQATSGVASYTAAMGDAANHYHESFKFAHPLPVNWRWAELWERMLAAAPTPTVPTDTMAKHVVMEFNGDRVPQFSQGFKSHEMLSIVTAETCTELCAVIEKQSAENKRLRRMLCVAYCGDTAYMDDGEASDSSVAPFIDFLREPLDDIETKLRTRALNWIVEQLKAQEKGPQS